MPVTSDDGAAWHAGTTARSERLRGRRHLSDAHAPLDATCWAHRARAVAAGAAKGAPRRLHGRALLRRRAPCLPCRPTDPGECADGARSLRGPSSLLSLSVRHTSSSSSARSLARSRVPRASLVSWSGGVDLASAASRATVVVVVLRYTQLSSSSPSVELSRFEGGKNKVVVGGASGSE